MLHYSATYVGVTSLILFTTHKKYIQIIIGNNLFRGMYHYAGLLPQTISVSLQGAHTAHAKGNK